MKPFYQGEAYSHDQILALLRSRGLRIDDEKRARQILTNVSYTRLYNYMMALTESGDHRRFRPGTSFEQVYALYGFDRRLRELIFHELEKIEISIRTHIAFACNGRERGYWFLNPVYFRTERSHRNILRHIKAEIERSDNEAILKFKARYADEFPPSWITLEAVSMGTLNIIYSSLGDESVRRRISGYYGLDPDTLTSWISHLVAVRNSCAHHNRVWNSTPSVKAAIPLSTAKPFPRFGEQDRNGIYLTLCIIKYLQNSIKPSNSFGCRLKALINNFKMIDPALMGFPKAWDSMGFWQDLSPCVNPDSQPHPEQ